MEVRGLSLKEISLSYGSRSLFEGLSADFAPGSWTVLLGGSGVGKSSLLRIIARLPMEDADVAGHVSDDQGQSIDGQVAYMAQRDLLLPWASVLENVLIGSRLRSQAPNTDRAKAILDKVGLGDVSDLLPSKLSGGMRQRVAVARTLMEDKPIVLMDEPFSATDALTRLRLQDLASTVLAGRTVIFVTHDPQEALRVADRICILSGRPAVLREIDVVPDAARPRGLDVPGLALGASKLVTALEPEGATT